MEPLTAVRARAHVRALEHTADLGLEVEAADLDHLLAAAAIGLVDVIVDAAALRVRERRELRLAAPDRDQLLRRLLAEVLYLYDAERWLAAEVAVAAASAPGGGLTLTAGLGGERFDPERHQVQTEVKAVTYHGLEVKAVGDGLRARVILDL